MLHPVSFPAGVTVAYVKAVLAQQYGLELSIVKLYFADAVAAQGGTAGRLLIDPLSLSDCLPDVGSGAKYTVEVVVDKLDE